MSGPVSALYIPTRDRTAYVVKSARRAAESGLPVYVVSEKQYRMELKPAIRRAAPDAEIVWLPSNNQGIGYARHWIIRHAHRSGYASIAMIDDDQLIRGDIAGWLRAAARDDVVGIGAWKSIYGLYFMNTEMAKAFKAKRSGLYLHNGSKGNCSVAFNVANVLGAGNYDPRMKSSEDTYIQYRGMIEYGVPWYMHTGVEAGNISSQKDLRANDAGGNARFRTSANVDFSHAILDAIMPGYFVRKKGIQIGVKYRAFIRDFIGITEWPIENIRTDEPWDWVPNDS